MTIGAGGGPHHKALLGLVERLADVGSRIDVVRVDPSEGDGVTEDLDPTLEVFDSNENVHVHDVSGGSIADALVDEAERRGSVLVVGATRTRFYRKWVFGSTTDQAVRLAEARDIPILVYSSAEGGGFSGRIEEALFVPYRYLRKHLQ